MEFDRNHEAPDFLYRYRSENTEYFWDELTNAINHRRFFLTSSTTLNDPFEFRPNFTPSKLKDVLAVLKGRFGNQPTISRNAVTEVSGLVLNRNDYRRSVGKLKPSVATAKKEEVYARLMFNRLPKQARVACFSENLQSTPMWGHYSNNHKGVCIKFKLVDAPVNLDVDVCPLRVKYKLERPSLSTIDILDFLGRGIDNNADSAKRNKVLSAFYLTKPQDWQYEKEWRIFVDSKAPPKYHTAPMFEPVGIYFGIRADDEMVSKAVSKFGHKVRVFKSEICDQHFEFRFVEKT